MMLSSAPDLRMSYFKFLKDKVVGFTMKTNILIIWRTERHSNCFHLYSIFSGQTFGGYSRLIRAMCQRRHLLPTSVNLSS